MPAAIWNQLYHYQRVSVQWLWELHQQRQVDHIAGFTDCIVGSDDMACVDLLLFFSLLHRVGGIIGDEMGLGKTIQLIAFLAALHFGDSAKTDGGLRLEPSRSQEHVTRSNCGAILIICPATVVHQWVAEFHKWWPPFRVLVCHASGTSKELTRTIRDAARGGPGHILITSYGQIHGKLFNLLQHEWHYVILDEGHKVSRLCDDSHSPFDEICAVTMCA